MNWIRHWIAGLNLSIGDTAYGAIRISSTKATVYQGWNRRRSHDDDALTQHQIGQPSLVSSDYIVGGKTVVKSLGRADVTIVYGSISRYLIVSCGELGKCRKAFECLP
jgi:hypothetical protein